MDNRPWEVVVVSSNLENRQDVAGILFRLGIDPICLSTVDQCRNLRSRKDIGLVFCDRHVKDGDYRDILSAVSLCQAQSTAKVVMMAELDTPEEYQCARQHGLFDIISSPCRATDVEWMVIQAKRNRHQGKELVAPSRNLSLLWKAAGAGA
jgi:DNA-binding NtrC family response regulator